MGLPDAGVPPSVCSRLRATASTFPHKGGKLKLLHLPPKINDVLTVTQLITVFDVYESESEALASYRG